MDIGYLSGLIVGVSKGCQISVFACKLGHSIDAFGNLWQENAESVTVDDQVSVVRYVTGRRAKVYDATSRWCGFLENMIKF